MILTISFFLQMPWYSRVWLTVDEEMAKHLGVSIDEMQRMDEEEFTRANYKACQEAVRRCLMNKQQKKALLKENKKWFSKIIKLMIKNRTMRDINNNTIQWVPTEPELFYNEKGEEISDWDDQRWDELNSWTF